MNKLINLPPKSVEFMAKDNIIMIDIRRPEEWTTTGVIKNSHLMTFFDIYGNCDITSWMKDFQKIVTSKEQQFILICAHANRTRTVGNYLIQNHDYTNVTHLEGGMALWCEEKREVVFN